MVPLPRIDLGSAEQLFKQHHACQLMRKSHFAHGHAFVGTLEHIRMQAERAADQKGDVAFALRKKAAHFGGK